MASTVVADNKTGNDRYIEILFTSGAAASEHGVELNPGQKITVTRFDTNLEAGTGTAVNPALGIVAAFSSGDFAEKGSDITGAPAARVGTTEKLPIQLTETGILYVQPRVDAAADNTIRVGLHIADGWI